MPVKYKRQGTSRAVLACAITALIKKSSINLALANEDIKDVLDKLADQDWWSEDADERQLSSFSQLSFPFMQEESPSAPSNKHNSNRRTR